MEKKKLIYEGKAKKVFTTDDESLLVQEFKDEATAFDGKKKGKIIGKGSVNAQLSACLFSLLEEEGIATHFIELLEYNVLLTKKLNMIPIEVIVRNIAAGSLAERIGYEEGQELKEAIVEYYYKSDELGDPIINEDHIAELELTEIDNLKKMKELSLQINKILIEFFKKLGIILVDFKLEFGLLDDQVILGDEISPDTCRLWDIASGEILDKDRFRRDLGKVEEAYHEVLRRVKEDESVS